MEISQYYLDILYKALQGIDKCRELGAKGLARFGEVNEAEVLAKNALHEVLDKDSELGRMYEKYIRSGTVWKIVPKDGFAVRSHIAQLSPLRDFITNFLEQAGAASTSSTRQQFIKSGDVYTARQKLRTLLKEAKETVDIQDNYIDIEILNVIEDYVAENDSLRIRITTNSRNLSNTFKSDLRLFISQYGRTEVKSHQDCHGRFIIIDHDTVYHSGYSFKDLGKKADLISLVDDPKAKRETLEDFEKWWEAGELIT